MHGPSNVEFINDLVVFRLSPCSECSLCSFGNLPSIRSIKADVSELNVSSIVLIAQDNGTDIEFRNVGFYTSDAGEIPKRTQTDMVCFLWLTLQMYHNARYKNTNFANVQQAKQIYQYNNIKKKLYTANAAVWYNKRSRQKQLKPKHGKHNI